MNNMRLKLSLCCIVIISIFSLPDGALAISGKISSGNYHPGTVLIYKSSTWTLATPDDVDYSENNYVFVHGAHSSSESPKTYELARAILKEDPDANVFVVDWKENASFNENQLTKVISDQLTEFAAEWLVRLFIDMLVDDDSTKIDYEEMVGRHLQSLIGRVLFNIMPVEQTKYIPNIAERAAILLFHERGEGWDFQTNNEKASFVALGLDPKKTHIIGHSHGAHVAGLICVHSQKELGKTVKRLSALDPSPANMHIAEENKNGNGWSKNVANFVDVYRTSLLCSSDKLYGHFNLFIKVADHPLLHLDEVETQDECLEVLATGLATDIQLHTSAINVFIGLIENGDFLTETPDKDDLDSSEWLTIDVDE